MQGLEYDNSVYMGVWSDIGGSLGREESLQNFRSILQKLFAYIPTNRQRDVAKSTQLFKLIFYGIYIFYCSGY